MKSFLPFILRQLLNSIRKYIDLILRQQIPAVYQQLKLSAKNLLVLETAVLTPKSAGK